MSDMTTAIMAIYDAHVSDVRAGLEATLTQLSESPPETDGPPPELWAALEDASRGLSVIPLALFRALIPAEDDTESSEP